MSLFEKLSKMYMPTEEQKSIFETLSKMNMTVSDFNQWCQIHNPILTFNLLTYEQVFGEKGERLKIFDKISAAAGVSDLAGLLGADIRRNSGINLGYQWTETLDSAGDVRIVNHYGNSDYIKRSGHSVSVRPVLVPSETVRLIPKNSSIDENGIETVEYGEYPQMAADEQTSQKLEELHQSGSLKGTGKSYTFVEVNRDDIAKNIQYEEYEYQGKKYIRYDRPHLEYSQVLSNGVFAHNTESYWIEVQPIKWLVDPSGTWISEMALISGIPYDRGYKQTDNFQATFLGKYLNNFFAQEMGHQKRLAEITQEEQEVIQKERDKILTGLSAQLAEAISGKSVKAIEERLRLAEKDKKKQTPPDRLREAAKIKRLKNARDILLAAHTDAQERGDDELADAIVDLARPYNARYTSQQNKVRYRRAKRKQGSRG